MAVLSSRNGKFYEIPDADLKKYELPAAKVKEVLAEMDEGPDGGPRGVEPYAGGPAQVVIHVSGSGTAVDAGPPEGDGGRVEPYGYWGGHGYGWGHGPYWGGWRRKRYYWYGY